MIKSIEKSSVHRITSGQVLVDLQTAVKELVENSLDARATIIDVKFKDYGLQSFEVTDNGSGIAPEDYDNVAMKHYTSKLATFEDLTTVQTFGFRGEALSSLCALSDHVTITTATAKDAPMGTILEFDKTGKVKSRSGKAARQRGTTVYVEGLFVPLPVRRKEFQRNSKREFGKALNVLSAYALVPCTKENKGVRLSVAHILDKGRKSDQIRTDGKPSLKASISSLWGPKQVDSLTDLNLDLEVVPEKTVLKRQVNMDHDGSATKVQVYGFISKFSPGHGRAGSDRQFFYINGRPCNPSKIQKAFNEVYRSFNANQSPFIVADFIVPTDSYDINVSPDKRTILLHSENALVASLKEALEVAFAPSRSTFAVQATQSKLSMPKSVKTTSSNAASAEASASSSQDGPLAVSTSKDAIDDDDANTIEIIAVPPTQRSPTPSLAVPASFLESEEASSEDPVQIVLSDVKPSPSDDARPQSPLSHPLGVSTSDPPMQPRPASPAFSSTSSKAQSGLTAVSTKADYHPVQMALDTTKTTWNMSPVSVELAEPVRKKRKRSGSRSTNSRTRLRARLLSFRSVGSQPAGGGESDDELDAVPGEDSNDAEGGRGAKCIIEEDELMEEELEEMQMDADADLDDLVPANETCEQHHSATSDSAKDTESDALFLPEPDEHQALRHTAAPRVKVEPIEIGLDADNSNSLITTDASNARAQKNGSSSSAHSASSKSGSSTRVEVMRTADPSNDVTVSFSIQRADFIWDVLSAKGSPASNPSPASPQMRDVKPVDPLAGVSNISDEESAERELARVIDKEDFASMEIIGQFNLGFIITRRRLRGAKTIANSSDDAHIEQARSSASVELDDLFIIDQHAADEKYNFETLQQTTKIDSQKLYKPRSLELTAADELLALENMDVLKSNGFEIIVDEDTGLSQGRIKLFAQPVSGSTNFDTKDLEELLHLMQDRPAGQKMVRCSKARAMFAMRACRKSVMIGNALNKSQMVSIVRHMGTMDQPWNCPHGRPTMRHLSSLSDVSVGVCASTGSFSRGINWDNL